jgi:zinc transport system substrate-binding protein
MKPGRSVSAIVLAFLLAACASAGASGRLEVAASIYPLAAIARAVGGPGVRVVDLTPPGAEAHDSILTPRGREDIERADLVLYLGPFGFQPEIEAAAAQRSTGAVAVAAGLGADISSDPHVWLDPVRLARIVVRIGAALASTDPAHGPGYRGRARALADRLLALDGRYRRGLRDCRYHVALVGHEAFGYLLARYGLRQVGFSGVNPEGEPTPSHLEEAERVLTSSRGHAVFFEQGGEGAALARQFAASHHLPSRPLATLEVPPPGGLLHALETNLNTLRRGLACG